MSFLMENWQNFELAAIRVGFGEGLVDIAKKNNLVVALSAGFNGERWLWQVFTRKSGVRGQLKLAWRNKI